jgi:hypothetical protein
VSQTAEHGPSVIRRPPGSTDCAADDRNVIVDDRSGGRRAPVSPRSFQRTENNYGDVPTKPMTAPAKVEDGQTGLEDVQLGVDVMRATGTTTARSA